MSSLSHFALAAESTSSSPYWSSSSAGTSSGSSTFSIHASRDAGTTPNGTFSERFDTATDYDLILESNDAIRFKVHRARLAGSTVFHDMLALGDLQEAAYNTALSHSSDIPIVALSEDAETLEAVLPFFYQEFVDVDSMDFELVLKAFEAAAKYGMTLVEHTYTARLKRMMPKDMTGEQAYDLWRLCTVLDRPALAGQALGFTTRSNIMQFQTTDINSLTPRDVDRLWRIHMQQTQARADALFKYAWQSSRGECFFFNALAHSQHMQSLVLAKFSLHPCQTKEPLGFRTCDKCKTMADNLGV